MWNTATSNTPVQTYSDHIAAVSCLFRYFSQAVFQLPCITSPLIQQVKAIAWSPHQHGLLASGGGTADRCIRFWNTLTGQPLQSVDTGSQVCNLAWSKHSNELVSTHGYSQNQILVWKYPSLVQMAKLTGHSYRVLYLVSFVHIISMIYNGFAVIDQFPVSTRCLFSFISLGNVTRWRSHRNWCWG